MHYYWDNFNNESISTGISLIFMSKAQLYKDRRNPESRMILNIKWSKPIPTSTSLELIRKNKGADAHFGASIQQSHVRLCTCSFLFNCC